MNTVAITMWVLMYFTVNGHDFVGIHSNASVSCTSAGCIRSPEGYPTREICEQVAAAFKDDPRNRGTYHECQPVRYMAR